MTARDDFDELQRSLQRLFELIFEPPLRIIIRTLTCFVTAIQTEYGDMD